MAQAQTRWKGIEGAVKLPGSAGSLAGRQTQLWAAPAAQQEPGTRTVLMD